MTIIATTNFSEAATNAVEYAAGLAKLTNTRLILFNAFVFPIHAANARISAEGFQSLLDGQIKELKQIADSIAKRHEIEVVPECTFSIVEDEIQVLIEKYDARLVVFGMHEKTLEQELMGSRTTAAIKHLHIPILTVPVGARFNGIRRILFAYDNHAEAPAPVLEKIRDAAKSVNAEVEVFSVDDTVERIKVENAASSFQDTIDTELKGIRYYYKNIRSNAVIKEIEAEIKTSSADLLIMIPKQYGFWSAMVHRSKTRIMASRVSVPLLSIPVDTQ